MHSGKLERDLKTSNNWLIRVISYKIFYFRNILYKFLAALLVMFSRIFPAIMKAEIKDKMNIVVRMQYRKKILFKVDSYREIRRSGFNYREPETVRWVEDCAKQQGVLYDVGANVGAVSMLYAANLQNKEHGIKNPRVLAFEPHFSTFSKLCTNVILNSFGGTILPFQFPLSNIHKAQLFKIQSKDAGSSGNYLLSEEDERNHSILDLPVITLTIDMLVFNFPSPDYLKIDVDGNDLEVLWGAEKVIASGKVKSILVEENDNRESIQSFLGRFGFVNIDISTTRNYQNLRFERQ